MSGEFQQTASFGPERITVRRAGAAPGPQLFVTGDYHVWGHKYSPTQQSSEQPPTAVPSTFAGSGAALTVLADRQQLARYEVVAAAGNQSDSVWHVVNLQIAANGTVSLNPVQRLQGGNAQDRF